MFNFILLQFERLEALEKPGVSKDGSESSASAVTSEHDVEQDGQMDTVFQEHGYAKL